MTFKTQQILVPFYGDVIPKLALDNAIFLAKGFSKEVCLCAMSRKIGSESGFQTDVVINYISALEFSDGSFSSIVDITDAIMVVWSREDTLSLNKQLNLCRDLRIPYLFIPKSGRVFLSISKMVVPIGFLIEEKEKAPWACSFGNFFGSDIILFEPNDKGSKAKSNSAFIQKVLNGYKLGYSVRKGKKNSFGIEKEGVKLALQLNAELAFITASRDFGLDDMFFGTKEYHILRKSFLPVLVLNPRGDIYVLCGS